MSDFTFDDDEVFSFIPEDTNLQSGGVGVTGTKMGGKNTRASPIKVHSVKINNNAKDDNVTATNDHAFHTCIKGPRRRKPDKHFGPNGLPAKKDGHWSFAHDPRQSVLAWLYKSDEFEDPGNVRKRKMLKFLESEEEFYLAGGSEKGPNTLSVIRKSLKSLKKLETHKANFENMANKLRWHKREYLSKAIRDLSYCEDSTGELSGYLDSLREQESNLEKQIGDIDMLIKSMTLRIEGIKEILQKYLDKKSILSEEE